MNNSHLPVLFITFHFNFLIDATFDFQFRICGAMFRTKLDLEWKMHRKSGSPFFDLRETISMILRGQVEEPKV